MIPTFETALLELIARYVGQFDTPLDEIISALELQLMAVQEELSSKDDE